MAGISFRKIKNSKKNDYVNKDLYSCLDDYMSPETLRDVIITIMSHVRSAHYYATEQKLEEDNSTPNSTKDRTRQIIERLKEADNVGVTLLKHGFLGLDDELFYESDYIFDEEREVYIDKNTGECITDEEYWADPGVHFEDIWVGDELNEEDKTGK